MNALCKTTQCIAETSSNKINRKKRTRPLPDIISPNQNAYVKNRCISEGGRLISDLLEMSEDLNKEGFLVTIDIEKLLILLITIS